MKEVWDSEGARVVTGDEVLKVIAVEAAKKHRKLEGSKDPRTVIEWEKYGKELEWPNNILRHVVQMRSDAWIRGSEEVTLSQVAVEVKEAHKVAQL